jgi:protein O-mannosyl-transferase
MAKASKKDVINNQQTIKEAKPAATNTAARFSIRNFRMQAGILILIGFIFYANTFSHLAAFDDRMAITDNEYVQQGVAGIRDILTKDAFQSYLEHRNGANQLSGGRYRPLSLITFAIEQQFMGVAPEQEKSSEKELRIAHEMPARHIVNVWLYILSTIVLLVFFRTVVFPDNPVAAFVAALIYAILPVHTEIVANVKSRDEILSVIFIALTFIKAFGYRESRKIKDLVLAICCFFLALLSKEYAVTLIVLLPLSFYVFEKEKVSGGIRATLPYLIPLGLYLLLRFNATTAAAAGAANNVMNNPYLLATGTEKLATEVMVLFDYLKLLVFPHPLIADYSYNQIPYTSFSNPIVWLSIVVHLALVACMMVLIKKRHLLGFAIAFYLINLLLISNILFNIGAPMGERLINHSSIGFAIAVAYLLYAGFEKLQSPAVMKMGLGGLMLVLVLLCGFKVVERNKDWKDDATLFLADVKKAPNNVLINNNAAAAYMGFAKRDKDDKQKCNDWFSKAITHFDKVIAINPEHLLAHTNRGLCYFNMGKPDSAIRDWGYVRQQNPNQENIQKYLSVAGSYYFNKGLKYKQANNTDSAEHAFRIATEVTPKVPEVWFEYGLACIAGKHYCEAKDAVDKILQVKPDYPGAVQLHDQLANYHCY